ncbi:hypothetical protein ACFX2B_013344 [Malus domestica]
MDRDRKANTKCTWFTHIGYVHEIEEFSLIVKGLHKYIGSSSLLVDVASSLEVLFLHLGVVSLTGGDAQGLFLNWAGGFSGFLQSIRPTEEFEGQNKSIKPLTKKKLKTFSFAREGPPAANKLVIDLTSSKAKKDGATRSEPVTLAIPKMASMITDRIA